MTTELILCPVFECRWALNPAPPEVPAGALASVFGYGTLAATSAYSHATDVERAIARHFDSHSREEVVESLGTMFRIVAAARRVYDEFHRGDTDLGSVALLRLALDTAPAPIGTDAREIVSVEEALR